MPHRNFVKMFDDDKTRMIGLPYTEKNQDNMLSRFHLYRNVTDRRTDGKRDRFAIIYQHRASVCWRAVKTTSSPTVAHRPRDVSCLSVVSFNSRPTVRRAQSSVISYFGFRFTAANKESVLFSSAIHWCVAISVP